MNDSYLEHKFHTTYNPQCSTCFSENVMVKNSIDKERENWVGRLMTKIIWGETGNWTDPSYRK